MADEALRSKHAFGSIENLQNAIDAGKIDHYDILFLTTPTGHTIGWIDKDGNKVILPENNVSKEVVVVSELPETGEEGIIYICGGKFYYWNDSEFVLPTTEGVDEGIINDKIETAVTTANNYTDEQINTLIDSMSIVEF